MRIPLLVLMTAWLCGACTCGGVGEAPAPTALDRSPAPIPDGWSAELRVDAAGLEAIRAQLPEGDARAAMPTRVADLAEGWVQLPPAVADRVEPGSPLRCLVLGRRGDDVVVCAMRVEPLPASIALTPGGPRGATWVAGEGAVAVADRVIVASREREAVELALPYLAFTAMEQPAEEGVRVLLAPGYAAGTLRPMVDAAIDQNVREARARIATERESHDAPPVLGEPEGLVDALAPAVRELAAYLPDLGRTELTLTPTPTGLALRARSEVREGSPLASWIASVPEPSGSARSGGPVRERAERADGRDRSGRADDLDAGAMGLDVIPASAVLAWSTRSTPSAADARPLAAIAGARLDEGGRASIEGALAEWSAARGPTSIAALGLAQRPYALFATDCTRPLDATRITAALATEWARTVLETPLGCVDRACPAAETAAREGGCVLAIRSPDDTALAADALGASAPLIAAPDVARELADAPADTLVRVIAIPERAPTLVARLVGSSEGDAGGSRAPVVLSIAREPGALVIDLRGSTAALGALLRVLGPS